jgi:hypothetical protein
LREFCFDFSRKGAMARRKFMSNNLILILEDNEDRIKNFQKAVKFLGEIFLRKFGLMRQP